MQVDRVFSNRLPCPLTHHPHAARAGHFVHVSTLFATDYKTGIPVQADSAFPYFGKSDIMLQADYIIRNLATILEDAGSALTNVLKAEVHLADPSDFADFKLVWKEYFPTNPPALTAVEVGDSHIIPGARLNLGAVALANDAPFKREVIHADDAPDTREALGASQAVKAGPFVFLTGLTATNYKDGIPVGRRPGFPNYGSDAEMQAHYVFENLNRILARAGTSAEQAVKSQLYEPDLSTFHDVDGIWVQYMPVPPPRSSMGMKGLLVPGAVFMPNLTVLVPDGQHQKEPSRAGILWHPQDVRKVNFSPCIKAGDWRFLAGQVATADFMGYVGAPARLPYFFSDIEIQTEFVMGYLKAQLEANESDLDHVVDAKIYLLQPRRDYRGFERAWRRFYPEVSKAPAVSIIPSTGIMFPGPQIEIDFTAVTR